MQPDAKRPGLLTPGPLLTAPTNPTKVNHNLPPSGGEHAAIAAAPPAGWDPDVAAERIRSRAQAERMAWARRFAALHHTDPAEIDAQAADDIRKTDLQIAGSRELLAAEGSRR